MNLHCYRCKEGKGAEWLCPRCIGELYPHVGVEAAEREEWADAIKALGG